MIFWERNRSRRAAREQRSGNGLWGSSKPFGSGCGTTKAPQPVPRELLWHRGCSGRDGAFLQLLGTPRMVCCDGTRVIARVAPVPCSRCSPGGNGIFGLISPGSHLRVPGFDSRLSPVIMWLPGKEGSRRNWLLCLAPLQEVFLLGGTKVRAGWEAFPHSSPHTCAQPWQGGTKEHPHHPSMGLSLPLQQPSTPCINARDVWSSLCVFQGAKDCFAAVLERETSPSLPISTRKERGGGGWECPGMEHQQRLGCRKSFFNLFL